MSQSQIRPVDIADLMRVSDRSGFVYFERAIINRDSNAITAKDERGTTHIPAASIATLLLGPGISSSPQYA